MHRIRILLAVGASLAAILACSAAGQPVVYVTATPPPALPNVEQLLPNPFRATPTPVQPTATAFQPTPNPPAPPVVQNIEHTVAAGDTLSGLAAAYGTDVNIILNLNPGLSEATPLQTGQILIMPANPSRMTPPQKLIPDSELVNSPAAARFDLTNYVRFQPGFIRVYSEQVSGRWMSGTDIVAFHALSASVNPRLILALLEYRGGWITNPIPTGDALDYPMGYRDERVKGLFAQVAWAVNQLNEGYYGWRTRGLRALVLPDSTRLAYAPTLNGGTVGVQLLLARTARDRATWDFDVSQAGFFTTYMALFGDPFRDALDPLVPPGLTQPELSLPFLAGQTWYITSGPHGGWDARASGWSAIDFAPPTPPDDLLLTQGNCYISPDFVTSMSGGQVVRSGDGAVVIDLDMDGDERTGWTILYLHLADQDRAPLGAVVQPGTPLGRPSCEGFYLNSLGTHVHIARRYNGEWIVADCPACLDGVSAPPFVLGGWTLKGYPGQVYQGWLEKDGQVRRAEQGRDDPTNQVSW